MPPEFYRHSPGSSDAGREFSVANISGPHGTLVDFSDFVPGKFRHNLKHPIYPLWVVRLEKSTRR